MLFRFRRYGVTSPMVAGCCRFTHQTAGCSPEISLRHHGLVVFASYAVSTHIVVQVEKAKYQRHKRDIIHMHAVAAASATPCGLHAQNSRFSQ